MEKYLLAIAALLLAQLTLPGCAENDNDEFGEVAEKHYRALKKSQEWPIMIKLGNKGLGFKLDPYLGQYGGFTAYHVVENGKPNPKCLFYVKQGGKWNRIQSIGDMDFAHCKKAINAVLQAAEKI